jgi:hypothetical protein
VTAALQGRMRRPFAISFVLISSILALASAAAETRLPNSAPSSQTRKVLPLKGTAGGNSCAAYGLGFVKVDGTGSCVKIGGTLDVGVAAPIRR